MAWFHCKNCYSKFEQKITLRKDVVICPICNSQWNEYLENPPDIDMEMQKIYPKKKER